MARQQHDRRKVTTVPRRSTLLKVEDALREAVPVVGTLESAARRDRCLELSIALEDEAQAVQQFGDALLSRVRLVHWSRSAAAMASACQSRGRLRLKAKTTIFGGAFAVGWSPKASRIPRLAT